jgi:hypothetical protein
MRIIAVFSSFLIILLSSSSHFGQTIICDFCKKSIETGQYLQVDQKYFHSEHFICEKCKKQIKGSYYPKDGKYYHENCYKSTFLKKCSHCKKPIEGEYFVINNKTYHQNCYDNYIADKCAHCNKIIKGEHFEDYWGNKYHYEHYGTVPMCEYCQKLISFKLTGGSTIYDDGRVICKHCKSSAVSNLNKAQRLLEDVMFSLSLQNILIKEKEIELHLVDLKQLRIVSKNGSKHSNLRGYATYHYTKENDVIVKKEFDIYILSGMPSSYYKMVAAHELMHIWQYQNSDENISKILSEGSCEYASYLLLRKINNSNSKYLIWQLEENKDAVYGEGFRRVKKFVEKNGKTAWLNLLKNEKDFPQGY